MFLVKNRSEFARFALFLALICGMAFFVASKMATWMKAAPQPVSEPGTEVAAEERETVGVGNEPIPDFYAAYRIDRERARAELKETLREVMTSQTAEEATRHEANQRYLALGRAAEIERQAESLLRAKGFAEAIVEFGEGNVQVIVRAQHLDRTQAAQVVDIVARLTGVKPQQIHIITRAA